MKHFYSFLTCSFFFYLIGTFMKGEGGKIYIFHIIIFLLHYSRIQNYSPLKSTCVCYCLDRPTSSIHLDLYQMFCGDIANLLTKNKRKWKTKSMLQSQCHSTKSLYALNLNRHESGSYWSVKQTKWWCVYNLIRWARWWDLIDGTPSDGIHIRVSYPL